MEILNKPVPCSRCGGVDSEAVVGAAVVLEHGTPVAPGRALVYCRKCMASEYGKMLVPLKRVMDVTWEDLRRYVREGYLRISVLDVAFGKGIQEKLIQDLDGRALARAAALLGKTAEELRSLLSGHITYSLLWEALDWDTDDVVRKALCIAEEQSTTGMGD